MGRPRAGFSFEAGGRTFRPVVCHSTSGTLRSILAIFFSLRRSRGALRRQEDIHVQCFQKYVRYFTKQLKTLQEGRGDSKTFHKNRKLKILFILILKKTGVSKTWKSYTMLPYFKSFIHLILRFYYNTSVNSHTQLSTYSKETHTQLSVVSTWNSAIYGAIKHVSHTCLFDYV